MENQSGLSENPAPPLAVAFVNSWPLLDRGYWAHVTPIRYICATNKFQFRLEYQDYIED